MKLQTSNIKMRLEDIDPKSYICSLDQLNTLIRSMKLPMECLEKNKTGYVFVSITGLIQTSVTKLKSMNIGQWEYYLRHLYVRGYETLSDNINIH